MKKVLNKYLLVSRGGVGVIDVRSCNLAAKAVVAGICVLTIKGCNMALTLLLTFNPTWTSVQETSWKPIKYHTLNCLTLI